MLIPRIYTEMECNSPVPTHTYRDGEILNYILSLADTFPAELVLSSCSVNQKSWKWSIMALAPPPQPPLPPSFTFLQLFCGWVRAQAECAHVCKRLFKCVSGARITLCPPFHSKGRVSKLSFLFVYSYLGMIWFPSHTYMMLPTFCWVQGSAAYLSVSKLCGISSLLALLFAVILLSVQAGTKREFVTLSPVLLY